MSIQFKVIQRGQPGVAGGGEKKFYAIPVADGEVSLEEITHSIEQMCTVNGADIRAVLYALVNVAVDNLANGTIVRFGELGSLRVSLSSEGKATADEVTGTAIRNASVVFTPGGRIKTMLDSAKFTKA
jgi:predicted histone-like DNA-binding protein